LPYIILTAIPVPVPLLDISVRKMAVSLNILQEADL